MKTLIATCLVIFALSVDAADRSITFSAYSPALTLLSLDEARSEAEFEGELTTSGVLILSFAWGDDKREGDVYARFLPDKESVAMLPHVSAGFYAAPISYVDLMPALDILETVLGKERFATLPPNEDSTISVPVEVTFYRFSTSAECESRHYYSHKVTVRPLVKEFVADAELPGGC